MSTSTEQDKIRSSFASVGLICTVPLVIRNGSNLMLRTKLGALVVVSVAVCQTLPVSRVNAEPVVTTEIRTFSVPGSSAEELLACIKDNGPHANGSRVLATTSAIIRHMANLKDGKSCSFESYNVVLSFVITLPKAENTAAMSAAMREHWIQFIEQTKWPEDQHRAICIGCGRRPEQQVKRIRDHSNCDKAWEELRTLAKAEFASCDRLHQRFGRIELDAVSHVPMIARARHSQLLHAARSARQKPTLVQKGYNRDIGR